jgi:hypothetical protein
MEQTFALKMEIDEDDPTMVWVDASDPVTGWPIASWSVTRGFFPGMTPEGIVEYVEALLREQGARPL